MKTRSKSCNARGIMADTSVEDTSRLPNALTIAAMEEGDRIAHDPNHTSYSDLDKLWKDLGKQP